MNVLPASMYYITYVHSAHGGKKRALIPWSEVRDSYELPCGFWEINVVLSRAGTLLTTDLSPVASSCSLYYFSIYWFGVWLVLIFLGPRNESLSYLLEISGVFNISSYSYKFLSLNYFHCISLKLISVFSFSFDSRAFIFPPDFCGTLLITQ